MILIKDKKLITSYILLACWMVVIFLLSSEGHDASTGRSDFFVEILQSTGSTWSADTLQFLTRKAAHIVAYIILGGLAYNVVRQHRLLKKPTILISMVIPIVYATTDEFHQKFVPGRSGEVRDVMIDSIAGIVGVLLAIGCHSILRKRQQNDKV